MFFNEVRLFLRVKHQELCDVMGISLPTWNSSTRKKKLPLKYVVKVCNEYHIPISCFIRTESEPRKELTIVDPKRWTPIVFNNVLFGYAVKEVAPQALSSVSEENGMSRTGFNSWYKVSGVVNTTLTADRYIEHCNHLGIYPMYAMKDCNAVVTVLDGYYNPEQIEEGRTFRVISIDNPEKDKALAEANATIKKLQDDLDRERSKAEFLEAENQRIIKSSKELRDLYERLKSVFDVPV